MSAPTNLVADQTVAVTGGASGIGRGVSLTFADHGADVVVADIRETPREGGTPTVERIREETDRDAAFVECDVALEGEFDPVLDAADEFGGVDTLVNNAAIAEADDFDITTDRFEEFVAVNVRGYFLAARAVANHLVEEERGGSIINVSSTEAMRTPAARPVYAATRGAVRNLTFGLAGRFADAGIRVNALYPGLFVTAMTTDDIPLAENLEAIEPRIPMGRHGEVDEVGGPAVFLASNLASYVTAAELVVDGGITYVSG
jgi:NAD(P)-dependent dehydrogenase (short-subunit alcohol dehydrogenase family)